MVLREDLHDKRIWILLVLPGMYLLTETIRRGVERVARQQEGDKNGA